MLPEALTVQRFVYVCFVLLVIAGYFDLFRKDNGLKEKPDRLTAEGYRTKAAKVLDKSGGSGIIKAGGEDVVLEYQRYGRNKSTLVNKTYIDSGEYRKKFDKLTDNPEINKSLYDCAKAALNHRSGTLIEDMYWIDSASGKIVTNVIDQTNKITERVEYPVSVKKIIRSSENLIALHTHPQSMPPSAADFNSCMQNRYKVGVVACHDGKVFGYTSSEKISEDLYILYIEKYKNQGHDEYTSQLMALAKLKENYAIDFWEVN